MTRLDTGAGIQPRIRYGRLATSSAAGTRAPV